MTVLTEGPRNEEGIVFQVSRDYCIEEVTFAVGNNIGAMSVVKGPATAVVPAVAADTANLFIAPRAVDATTVATKGIRLMRGPAVVNRNLLNYPAGATAPQRAAIDAALLAADIRVDD